MKKPTSEEIATSARLLSEQLHIDEATCRTWLEAPNPFEGFDSMILSKKLAGYQTTASVEEISRLDICHA